MSTENKKLADRITNNGIAAVFNKNFIRTDTSKIAHANNEADAELIAEAFNVTNETGLSPRELKEERDELALALEYLVKAAPNDGTWNYAAASEKARQILNKVKPQTKITWN